MKSKHIAFCLDQAYGNIIPTVGIALALIERGHRVSYTVTSTFAPVIRKIEATPVVIEPLDTRGKVISAITVENDHLSYVDGQLRFCEDLLERRTAELLLQLERLFANDYPDLILHDDSLDTAGRDFASKWGIARIRHHSQFLDKYLYADFLEGFSKDELIMMTIPEFFQRDRQLLDGRFKFVGFVQQGRTAFFEPWKAPSDLERLILVSATSGLLPQRGFYKTMIEAIANQPWNVILSISASRDPISAIDPQELANLPSNVQLNTTGSNFDIVKHASLYIGQGGQGGALESIYWGVPQIVIPPEPYHNSVARRVRELDLGYAIAPADVSAAILQNNISKLLEDRKVLERVTVCGQGMRDNSSAQLAVDLIESRLM